jgi:type IV pilus assembly protein PilX
MREHKKLRVFTSERGAALIISLVFMLILTIIGAASMQSATLQERMAGNARNIDQAFQAAEAALREAEVELAKVSVGPFNGSGGLYLSCADPTDTRTSCKEPAWNDHASKGWKVLANNTVAGVSQQPEFIIEELSSVADPDAALDSDKPIATMGYYRVTARGYGSSDRGIVVLSTTYKRDGI